MPSHIEEITLNWTGRASYFDIDQLPEKSAIYTIYNDCELLYIGETGNLKNRFNYDGKEHHFIKQQSDYERLYIVYTDPIDNEPLRKNVEQLLIRVFRVKGNIKGKRENVEFRLKIKQLGSNRPHYFTDCSDWITLSENK